MTTRAKASGDGSASNASTSSAVGGMPQRSIVARRIRVRRLAGADGVIPDASSRARIWASIGDRTQPWFLTGGRADVRNGWKAQWAGADFVIVWTEAAVLPVLTGQGAPRATHRVRNAASVSDNFPLGGIFSSSWRYETARMRRLSSAFAGTTAGPVSPPLRMASRLSSRRPPDCFRGPWHFTQCSTRIGRTRASKNSTASGAGDAPPGFWSSARAEPVAQLDATSTPTRLNRPVRPGPEFSSRSIGSISVHATVLQSVFLPDIGVVRFTAGGLGLGRQPGGTGIFGRQATPAGDRPLRANGSRSVVNGRTTTLLSTRQLTAATPRFVPFLIRADPGHPERLGLHADCSDGSHIIAASRRVAITDLPVRSEFASRPRTDGISLAGWGTVRVFWVREWCGLGQTDGLPDRSLVNGACPARSGFETVSTIRMPRLWDFINASIAILQFFSPELSTQTGDKKFQKNNCGALGPPGEPKPVARGVSIPAWSPIPRNE